MRQPLADAAAHVRAGCDLSIPKVTDAHALYRFDRTCQITFIATAEERGVQ